ncbi:unnamed protein product [Cochlearia groenlandica]
MYHGAQAMHHGHVPLGKNNKGVVTPQTPFAAQAQEKVGKGYASPSALIQPVGWESYRTEEDSVTTDSLDGNDCGLLDLGCHPNNLDRFDDTRIIYFSETDGQPRFRELLNRSLFQKGETWIRSRHRKGLENDMRPAALI